jgi:multidrug efflux pump subunit AcrB
VDAGQFQIRIRPPTGSNLEVNEDTTKQTLEEIKEIVGPENIKISVAYVGIVAPTLTVNAIYLWSGGTDQSIMRIALREGSGIKVAELQHKLREELPKRMIPWMAKRLEKDGVPSSLAAERASTIRFSYEPSDVVNQVMSFGSPTPIEVVVTGPDLAVNKAYADKINTRLKQIPSIRDLQFVQALDYPRVMVDIDRERAGFAGINVADAANSLIAGTFSSRYVLPIFWADPNSGIGYQVQVEVPPAHVTSITDVGMIPVKRLSDNSSNGGGQLELRDIATIRKQTMPEEYDRLNQLRYISQTANIEGEDLGRVASHIDDAIKAAGELPRGVQVEVRGQVPPMNQMFKGLGVGLFLAVIMVFLLLTAYFQSIRLAIVASATAPAVVAGVVLALYITNTTLNIESFMGSIMAIGVAVANAILLVTFAERNRQTGMSSAEAAVTGASERLRPILMTSCAMIAGMFPMALGYGEGGEQTAALGRAVIGGLVAATFATLMILPHVFAVVLGRSVARSPSLHPHDRDSLHYDPTGGADTPHHGGETHAPHTGDGATPPHSGGGTPPPPPSTGGEPPPH